MVYYLIGAVYCFPDAPQGLDIKQKILGHLQVGSAATWLCQG